MNLLEKNEHNRIQHINNDVPMKVTTNEIVNFLLGHGMTILKLVQSGKFLNVESVRRNDICCYNTK